MSHGVGSGSSLDSNHHVHFDTASLKDEFETGNSVTFQNTDDGIVVRLGFLQINHKYRIDLKLPATSLKKFFEDPTNFIPDISEVVPNLNCHIINCNLPKNNDDNFIELQIEFLAYKEKLLKEQLKIVNSNNSEEILKLIIVARVLGRGKGTPMLRTGIHCIGVIKDDDDSEASDFQGFG